MLQTVGGFGAKGGGVSTCTFDLLSAIHRVAPGSVDLLTPEVRDPSDQIMGHGEEWIKAVTNDCVTPLGYSRELRRWLAAHGGEYQLLHANGMWMYVNHLTCAEARRRGVPYVITPHGMLYPEALRRSYWKKWPLIQLWFRRDVRRAACLHATCREEMGHIREFGYRGPVALIGNPVSVPECVDQIVADRRREPSTFCGEADSRGTLGFLGRLHRRKKVENLLYAVALRPQLRFRVLVIGSGDDEYQRFLRSEAERLGIADRVTFTGFLTGDEKFRQLARLSCLFVPSDMENFGMIVPEALLVGTPVMASLGTPWQALNHEQCGWWTSNAPETIATVLDSIAAKSPTELLDMGLRGRDYILQNFAADHIAAQMLQLYSWLLHGGAAPNFVHLS